MLKYDAVIFDLDGTLTDSQPGIFACAEYALKKMGLPVPDKVIFLDMAPEVADKLIAARAAETATKKDIHERDTDYLHRCHAAYLELADKYKWDKVICNAGENPRSIDAIHQDVYALVEQMLKK